jgi:hypothetical protein
MAPVIPKISLYRAKFRYNKESYIEDVEKEEEFIGNDHSHLYYIQHTLISVFYIC